MGNTASQGDAPPAVGPIARIDSLDDVLSLPDTAVLRAGGGGGYGGGGGGGSGGGMFLYSPALVDTDAGHGVHGAARAGACAAAEGLDICDVLPVELVLEIMTRLDVADITAVALVCKRWCRLTQSEAMWRFRCACLWPYIAAPDRGHPGSSGMGTGSCGSWLQACRVLSHGTLVCNSMGIVNGLEYLQRFDLVGTSVDHVAGFLETTRQVGSAAVGEYVLERGDFNRGVLRAVVGRQDYTRVFLPDALRRLFGKISLRGRATKHGARTPISSQAIVPIFSAFVHRYTACNPNHQAKAESLHLLCYSLLLLSVDLFNPHVKVKMTQHEFRQNNIGVLADYDMGYVNRLYDNVCLWGHVAQPRKERELTALFA